VKEKYARQIRRGILRANAGINHRIIYMPLTTVLEERAYTERIRRHYLRWQERTIAKLNTNGGTQ
tara:strand:- start:4055 stop:4249 length:195 start_codon:yes stop_codon:yes gene_type:complete